jgi:CRP-like cAMP-binding protein
MDSKRRTEMADETILNTLRNMEYFRGCSQQQLQRLAGLASEVDFPARKTIFNQHDRAENVYVIVSGRVSLAVCTRSVGCRQIMEVSAGDLIGWSPLLDRPRLSDTAATMTPVKALVFQGEALLNLCQEDTSFGYQFMRRTAKVLAERLGATWIQLLDAYGTQMPQEPVYTD